MRYWLLSNTTYGTWLPGSPRGSVTSVRDRRATDPVGSSRIEHDQLGEPWEKPLPALHEAALASLKGPPILPDLAKAELLLVQFQETASFRHWCLQAVAIMCNHFHLVVAVADDPCPKKILAEFKACGIRVLNQRYGQPPGKTWWTTNGSKRKLRDERHLAAAINYVLYKQPNPLIVWSCELKRPYSGR